MFRFFRGKGAAALILPSIVLLIVFGKQSSEGALKGIYFCLNDLLPSIFPFMVLSVFIVQSGASEIFGRVFGGINKLLFGFSPVTAAVIMMSMLGGYPVGAKGIAALYDKGSISEKEAASVSLIAVGAGPGFLISFAGIGLYGNINIGLVLFAAQTASIIILGILNKLIFVRKQSFSSDIELKAERPALSSVLISSVESGTYAALEMCGIVIMFSALLGIIGYFSGSAAIYIKVISEVTNACVDLSSVGDLSLTAFVVGFGGLCVHFQVFSALKNISLNKGLFFLFRIIQGLITTLITYLLIQLFGLSLPVFSSSASPVPSLSSSIPGSAALITSCLCFLYSIKKK